MLRLKRIRLIRKTYSTGHPPPLEQIAGQNRTSSGASYGRLAFTPREPVQRKPTLQDRVIWWLAARAAMENEQSKTIPRLSGIAIDLGLPFTEARHIWDCMEEAQAAKRLELIRSGGQRGDGLPVEFIVKIDGMTLRTAGAK